MRPYLAVIADSFRSALASRVLWVAMAAIWLTLFLLALTGYRENLTAEFANFDFYNAKSFKAMLAEGLADPDKTGAPIGRLARAMPDSLQRDLRRVGEGEEVGIAYKDLIDGLNHLIDERDWYDESAWGNVALPVEARRLSDLGDEASEEQSRRLARLRIEAVTPGVFGARPAISVRPTYAGFDFPVDLPMDKRQFSSLINQFVFPLIISWLLGFVLIFLGIVVTSPIIPGMLQPGSLHLLLSKPISRSGLLIGKFVGGCAFMLLCVTQLVIGLYLVAGLRLDVWNLRLLWCIPASVLLFSVFYSVSVMAGLIFRSEVLSIGLTCVFGAICLVTGLIGGLFDGFVRDPATINSLTTAGDQIVARTAGGGLNHFDPSTRRWEKIIENGRMRRDRILSPLPIEFDAGESPRIVTAKVKNGNFNPFGTGPSDLLVLDPDDQFTSQPSVRLPAATTSLYPVGKDSIAALNTIDLSVVSVDELSRAVRDGLNTKADADETLSPLAKLSRMMGRVSGPFRSILPPEVSVTPPRRVLFGPTGETLWVGSGSQLWRLRETDGQGPFEVTAKVNLAGEASRRFTIALTDHYVMISRDETPLTVYDRQSLESRAEIEMGAAIAVDVVGLPGDRFVSARGDGSLFLHTLPSADEDSDPEVINRLLDPSNVEAIAWDAPSDRLLVAHDTDCLTTLDATTLQPLETIHPSLPLWRWIDRYVVGSLRMIIPQTGELGNVIASMISGKSSVMVGDPSSDTTPVHRYHLARPLLSCGGFIVVMMLFNLYYFRTRDF